MKRRYLTSSEREDFIAISTLFDKANKGLVEWSAKDILTREEITALKYIKTYTKKFMTSVVNRQEYESLKAIRNAMKKSYVVIMNEFAYKNYMKKRETDIKAGFDLNKDFFDLVEVTMDANCKNCNKCSSKCNIFNVFESNYIQEFEDDTMTNCKYSYKGFDKEI